MRRRRLRVGAAAVALQLLWAAAAAAQERAGRLQVSGGLFNAGRKPSPVEVGVELSRPLRWWGLDLAAGVSATDDGAVWGYLGLRREVALSERIAITPTLAAALYERGDGKDLGGNLQFRSALGINYRITRRARIGLTVRHLSNAGLETVNPGSNSAALTYSVSLK